MEWNDSQTEVTVKINPAAKWNDGTAVTADDVVATWDIAVETLNGTGATYKDYVAGVEKVDDTTVVIKSVLTEDGNPANPLKIKDFLVTTYIAQKAWIDTVKERNNGDTTAILADDGRDAPYTGPYGPYFDNDQVVAFVRNEDYWGQDESLWGKLPVPKYVAHTIYADNAATEAAFRAGDIDIGQIFVPNIQNLWLEEDLPVATYMDEEPYGICLTMPTAWYNMNNAVLAENTALRKAIALAVDYDRIIEQAMTNQSPSFSAVPRSMMNPTDGEQAAFDHDAVADLQWAGNDIDGAKALLDEAGIVDSDGDGWREVNGEKISLNACCPNGWTDWQAAMEIVADAGKNIGVEITTLFPEWSTYQTVFTNPDQTEYDIFMYSPDGAGPSMPWGRVRQFLSSDFLGVQNNWSGNWGQYKNDRADEIISAIPLTTDEEELKALYTEAVEIYLTEVPSFSLMYRPSFFFAVNETIWTNYPEAGDEYNIPPACGTDGYGIRCLYELELVEG
ncbi:MAG: ABC transporter substrate-binding protein [Clostridia bacterium]|nr:ABC transporter substrate-binding protein [Clostridia bacterium]